MSNSQTSASVEIRSGRQRSRRGTTPASDSKQSNPQDRVQIVSKILEPFRAKTWFARIGFLAAVFLLLLTVSVGAPAATATSLPPAGPNATVDLLIKFKPGTGKVAKDAAITSVGGNLVRDLKQINTRVIRVPAQDKNTKLGALKKNAAVARAAAAIKLSKAGIPDDPGYAQQWALPKIAWDQAYGVVPINGSATIAVLDTGVDASHPDLAGRLVPGISEINGNPDNDPNGHGTALAGIAAADVNNGQGIAGVGYSGVNIASVQVLQADGTGSDADVVAGVLWASDNGAKVILMGFSSQAYSAALSDALIYAWGKGVVLVAATGNGGTNNVTYPAGMPNVIGVVSTDQNDNVDPSSDTGSAAVGAPGVGIPATLPGGNYGNISGTSAAAAHVAGLAAMLVANGSSNSAASNQILGATDPVNGASYGRINVAKALGAPAAPQPTATPIAATPTPGATPTYVMAASTLTGVSIGSQTGTVSYGAGGSVTYTVTVTRSGSGNLDVDLTLTTALPAGATASFNPSQVSFTGNTPTSKISTLTITTSNTTPAGGTAFTVQAKDHNSSTTFTANGTLTIGKAHLTVTADNKSRAYGDANPALTSTLSGFKNGETLATSGVTGSASCTTTATSASSVAGSPYPITCTQGTLAANNYDFTPFVAGNLTVTKAHLTVTADNQSRGYGDANPALTATLSGFKNGETLATSGVTGSASCTTVATSTSTVAGSPYAITCTQGTLAAGNYDFTPFVNGQLTVTKAHLTVTADNQSRGYGDLNPTFTFQISGFKNGETSAVLTAQPTCTTAAIPSSPVGGSPFPITCSGGVAANYSFNYISGNLTVTKAHLTVTADNQSRAYGDANPSLTATLSGFKNGETLATSGVTGSASCTTAATPSSPVGGSPYAITCTQGTLAAGNYDFTPFVNGQLTITKAHLTVTADNQSRGYGDANPTLTASYSGFKNGETLATSGVTGSPSLTTLATATSAVPGPYTITVGLGTLAANNYDFTFVNGNLTITKATLTVTADNQSRGYGDANPVFTASYSGFKNGETLATSGVTGSPSLTTLATATSAVPGPYTITAALGTLAAGNYSFSFVDGKLTITKAHLTVTADDKSREYGDANPSFTATVSGFKNGETLGTSGVTGSASCTTPATPSSPVSGSPYTISCTIGTLAAGNYDFTSFVDGKLTITVAHLTVTADDKSRAYGDANPALTATFTGFKNSETLGTSGVTGSPSLTTAATATSSVSGSPYTIAAAIGTLASGNYSFTFVNGQLTVTKATLTVTANDKSREYGDANPAFDATITGFKNGETLATSGVTGSASCSTTATNTSSVAGSPYPITCAIGTLVSGNYSFSFAAGNLTISKRPITVTADAKSKVYGDADPALTYQITSGSLAFSDTFAGVLARDAGENVGTYAIQQGTLALSTNYDLTYVGANLTISKRPITVTADAKSKVYGDADPALTYHISSGTLAFSDAFSGALTRAAGENVGTYAITQGTLALSTNYALTYVGANFSITARAITVTADAKSKVYGDADPALTYKITSGSLAFSDSFSGALTRDAGSNVGTYMIHLGTLALSSNYTLTFVGANLTVTPRPITVMADAKTKIVNAPDPALTYQLTSGSLVTGDSFSGGLTRVAGETAGVYPIQQASLTAGSNYALTYVGANLTIMFAPNTSMCDGSPGHTILQPINSDGTSVWKARNTIPVKFRVCDANGVSIGGSITAVFDTSKTGGVAAPFMWQAKNGSSALDEVAVSNTPDSQFRWSATDQQWIFNLNTNNLSASNTYYYHIYLLDGSMVDFVFGLK